MVRTWAVVTAVISVLFFLLVGAVTLLVRCLFGGTLLQSHTAFRADLPTIVERLQDLSRLETASFQAQKIVEAKNQLDPLPAWLAGDRVVLVAHGEVTAGVDLSNLRPADIHADDDTIHVHLPPARIFAVRLDDRSYVYDHHPGVFSRVDPDLESEARAEAEQEFRSAATTSGLLQRADANAHTTITKLLQDVDGRTVVFE